MSDFAKREWRFYVDNDTVWSIVTDDLPALLQQLLNLRGPAA